MNRPTFALLFILSSGLSLIACGPSVTSWTNPAEAAYAEGDLTSAIAIYQDAIGQFPEDPALKTRLALLLVAEGDQLMEAGEPALASDRYSRAREVGGSVVESPSLFRKQAAAREKAGAAWSERAALLAEAFEAEETKDAALAEMLAIGWDSEGDPEEALRWYTALLELKPNHRGALTRTAQIFEMQAKKQEALDTWKRFLTVEPESRVARVSLAALYEETGEDDEAEALLVAVAESDPDHPGGWKQLLRFYRRHNDAAGAERVRQKLNALVPPDQRKMRPLR